MISVLIEALRAMSRDRRSALPNGWRPNSIKPSWRKVVHHAERTVDWRTYGIAVIVHLSRS